MTKYQAKVEMPDQFKAFAQAVMGVAGFFKFVIEDDEFIIEFESDDEDQYELAGMVNNLHDELRAIGIYLQIPRPHKVVPVGEPGTPS